jgi:sugar lactone lactonase YvrE
MSLLVGNANGAGHVDGTGAAARFFYPPSVATDAAGNIYVAENGSDTIRKISPGGMVTTLAGTPGVRGSTDGAGAAATFNYPSGIATDSAGNLYVSDSFNCTIRQISPSGVVTTLAGTGRPGSADGTGTAASFAFPWGIAIDGAGNLYVADNNGNTVRKITQGGVVTTLAGTSGVRGYADGTGAAASFNGPNGIAADGVGNIYVADTGNSTVRKITQTGVVTNRDACGPRRRTPMRCRRPESNHRPSIYA